MKLTPNPAPVMARPTKADLKSAPSAAGASNPNGSAPNHEGTERKKINRRKRLQPGDGSFRPGRGANSKLARALTFIIPVLDKLGTDDEFSALRAAALEIAEHSEDVRVVGMGVENGEFRLKLHVPVPPDGDDDKLVSSVFRELQPFYEGSALFQASAGVPRWEYTIGDFAADKGSFA